MGKKSPIKKLIPSRLMYYFYDCKRMHKEHGFKGEVYIASESHAKNLVKKMLYVRGFKEFDDVLLDQYIDVSNSITYDVYTYQGKCVIDKIFLSGRLT